MSYIYDISRLRVKRGRLISPNNRLLCLTSGLDGGWVVSVTPRPLYPQERDTVPIVQDAGWAPGPVWTGAENLASHRDSIPGPSSP